MDLSVALIVLNMGIYKCKQNYFTNEHLPTFLRDSDDSIYRT